MKNNPTVVSHPTPRHRLGVGCRALARTPAPHQSPPVLTPSLADVAAAAVYTAKAEEARRNHDRPEQSIALRKWIATGDPQAVECRKEWILEDMEALWLRDMDSDEDTSDWHAFEAMKFREFWEFLWPKSFGEFEQTRYQVIAALGQVGRESSNLILGTDFTKSNEWSGNVGIPL
ncbi:E3 ubiquitin-protein ligase RGLG1 [Hordeum vulgare]|nr:E3 ubiquitin-protein ligase RGLG1 [Hordeum vulgare]